MIIQTRQNSELSSLFFYGLCCVLLVMVGACTPQQASTHSVSGSTMGTYYRVTLADKVTDSAALKLEIETALTKINRSMSTYLPDSEISQFNRSAAATPSAISAEFAHVLAQALQLAELTSGAFDITVNPLVQAWGFGSDGVQTTVPSTAQINAILTHTGYRLLSLQGQQLAKKVPQLTVDLSAIAKGFAIDQIGDLLSQRGYENWLVDIGGELKARGNKGDENWQVAIEQPRDQGGIHHVLDLQDSAIATSGDYRNYVELGGQRYSHIIDPVTGYPVTHQLASATVLHDSAMMADALATALLVMGQDLAFDFAQEQGLSVYLIVRDANAENFKVVSTGEFTRLTH